MHRTKIPLCTWFWAAYLVTTNTPGMSAWQLARQLNLRYETAYMMLQKLRAGMVNPERGRLRGAVEVDEAYIGGHQAGPGGRGARGKALIVGAVEVRNGKRAGRVRLQKIPYASAEHLLRFIQGNVEPGSTVLTDRWKGYLPLAGILSYRHRPVKGKTAIRVAEKLPHIHRTFSNLKSWLVGTHHGVSPKHLQAYLNEYAFRFNRRKTPMAAFQTALGIGARVAGPTYRGLYRGRWAHPNQ
jgi:transposase-like protein